MSKKVTYTLPPDADIESFIQFLNDAEKAAKERKEAEKIKKALLKKKVDKKTKVIETVEEKYEAMSDIEKSEYESALYTKTEKAVERMRALTAQLTTDELKKLDPERGIGRQVNNQLKIIESLADEYVRTAKDTYFQGIHRELAEPFGYFKMPKGTRLMKKGAGRFDPTRPYMPKLPGVPTTSAPHYYFNEQTEEHFLVGQNYFFPNLKQHFKFKGGKATDPASWEDSGYSESMNTHIYDIYFNPKLNRNIKNFPTPWEPEEE